MLGFDIRSIIEQIALHPENIEIEKDDFDRNRIRVWVHKSDMGKLVGEGGGKSQGIEKIIEWYGKKMGRILRIKFEEPRSGMPGERYKDTPIKDPWDNSKVFQMVSLIASAVLKHPHKIEIRDGKSGRDIGRTKIEVFTGKENVSMILELNLGLDKLFYAIGRANGRRPMAIEFIQKEEDAVESPDDATAIPSWDAKKWN